MKFEIYRTSDWIDGNQPVSAAYAGIDNLDYRTWFIDIGSLEDLMDLVKKVGPLVLYTGSIEIYDGYRE